LNDIYVKVDGRRFIAAKEGQPIPAHLSHLVPEKETTETQPAGALDSTKVEGQTSVAASLPDDTDRRFDLDGASDDQLLDLKAALDLELGSRELADAPPTVEVPDGVVPGETPGWPIDAETGEALSLPDSVREELATRPLAVDYDELDKEKLEELIEGRVKVLAEIEGTGSGGNVVKADLVKALGDADALAAAE
jgi:hypothetical protein